MAMKTERSLYVIEERYRTLSQLLERDVLLACVRIEASHCTTQLIELKMVASEISRDAVTLVIEMKAQQTDLSDSLQVLAEGLRIDARGQVEAEVALATNRNLEEERRIAQEQELLARLSPKAASFF